jgi:hypothetical protein
MRFCRFMASGSQLLTLSSVAQTPVIPVRPLPNLQMSVPRCCLYPSCEILLSLPFILFFIIIFGKVSSVIRCTCPYQHYRFIFYSICIMWLMLYSHYFPYFYFHDCVHPRYTSRSLQTINFSSHYSFLSLLCATSPAHMLKYS